MAKSARFKAPWRRPAVAQPPLPPGAPDPLDELERADRLLLQKRAAVLGPIFQGTSQGERQVCIMGLARGRRFLAEHGAHLRVASPDLTPLFPKGFLRVLDTGDHRHYKRALVRGLRSEPTQVAIEASSDAIRRQLDEHCERTVGRDHSAAALSATMASLATRLLVGVFFGWSDQSRFDRICAHFHQLGPHGFVWNPAAPQAEAFALLCDDLAQSRRSLDSNPCLLAALDNDGVLDETLIGNLIYMVEIGRFDLRNLLRWMIRYAADDAALYAALRGPDVGARAEAFVLEVLRSDQSERLERTALADIVFDGYLIPKDTRVRLCVWEAHHGEPFESAHRFDPSRFWRADYGSDSFAPFGLDHHQCPFGSLTIELGKRFAAVLAGEFDIEGLHDGAPVRGAYHWEPSRALAVRIERRAVA